MTQDPVGRPWLTVLQGAAALAATIGIGRFVYTPILPLMHEQAGLTAAQGSLLATTVSCQDAVGVRWLFAVGNQRNSAGSDMGSSFADCAWTASRRTARCVKDPVSTPDDRGARPHAGTDPGAGPGRVRHHRAAAGDLAPLTDSLWLW